MVNTKEELLQLVRRLTDDFDEAHLEVFTARYLGMQLNISRSLASQYLNTLVKEGSLVKADSRPVYFLHRKSLERKFKRTIEQESIFQVEELSQMAGQAARKHNNFSKAVGHAGSLSYCVMQLKSAMKYPGNGLPVLLIGEPGSGRKYLGTLMYEYGRDNQILDQQAPRLIYECCGNTEAEKEGKTLFGFAYQVDGKLRIKPGLLEQADQGMLIFENAHLLSHESQRKLAEYLVEGQFSRFNNQSSHKASSARLVFIVSEQGFADMMESLLRQIPVTCRIPPVMERPIQEKEELIMLFLKRECEKTDKRTALSSQALRTMLQYNFPGNVEEIKTTVTIAWASAFFRDEAEKEEISVILTDLPDRIFDIGKTELFHGEGKSLIYVDQYHRNYEADTVLRFFQQLLILFEEYEEGKRTLEQLILSGTECMNQFYDYIVFEKQYSNEKIKMLEGITETVFQEVSAKYSFFIPSNCSYVIARMIYVVEHVNGFLAEWERKRAGEIRRCQVVLQEQYQEEYEVVQEMKHRIEVSLDCSLSQVCFIFLMLNIRFYNKRIEKNRYPALIITHGYSTASSIADAVNKILGRHIFEALDMPLDTQACDILNKLKSFVSGRLVGESVILLVDMGSLELLGKEILEKFQINVGIINNISTCIAIDVGTHIMEGWEMDEILSHACQVSASEYSIYTKPEKEKAIVFSSELGTMVTGRVQQLFRDSMPESADVKLLTCGYDQLIPGEPNAIFSRYEVLFISGTFNPGIKEIPFLSLEEIITFDDTEYLDSLLKHSLTDRELEELHENLVKHFTLQNVIQYLTILNPDKLLVYVREAVDRLQSELGRHFKVRTQVGIDIHVSCLVERLVTKTPLVLAEEIGQFEQEHSLFIRQVETSFRELMKHYNIEIPLIEIKHLYDYVSNDGIKKTEDGEFL